MIYKSRYKKVLERLSSLEDMLGLVYKEDWDSHEATESKWGEGGIFKRITRLEDKLFPKDDKDKSRFDK